MIVEIYYIQTKFAEKLAELLMECNFRTLTSFARAINIPRKSLSNWLNLSRCPTIDAIAKIALFFDVSIEYLIGLED